MLVKLSPKNQLTLPESIIHQIDNPEYFEVSLEGGRVILTPVKVCNITNIREKLALLGISEQDVEDAIQWSRQENKQSSDITR